MNMVRVLGLAALALAGEQETGRAGIGQAVRDFKLRDVMKDAESFVSLSDYKDKKTVVLIFISERCDVTWKYEKRIGALMQDYGRKDVVFLGVRSSSADTAESIRKYAEVKNLVMPVLNDEKRAMADYFDAQVTPAFYVVDKKGLLRYRGSCDENANEKTVKKTFVREALNAVLEGRDVPVTENRAFG